jgi:hypothetical protein
MRIPPLYVCVTAAIVTLGAGAAATSLFTDDFSTMISGGCYADGQTVGGWLSVYDGYGCNSTAVQNGNPMLSEQPLASTAPNETHAGLAVGPATSGDVDLAVSLLTARQLRSGSLPNAWEVGWVLWNYSDNTHFYYFVPKPNGWELGKEDPAYPGAQRFLATGSSPQFPIGQWYRVRIAQSGSTIRVYVNDLLITTFTDQERAYYAGRVGLYNEDSQVYFDDVSATWSGSVSTPAPVKKGHRK